MSAVEVRRVDAPVLRYAAEQAVGVVVVKEPMPSSPRPGEDLIVYCGPGDGRFFGYAKAGRCRGGAVWWLDLYLDGWGVRTSVESSERALAEVEAFASDSAAVFERHGGRRDRRAS